MRIVGILKMLEPKFSIEFPATIKMVVLEHVECDGCGTHLVSNLEAALHCIDHKCCSKAHTL